MGWSTLIYMSSLGSIDEELYDACVIDGGGRFRQMVTVTLPGIMNVIMLQIILDVGGIMSDNYDQILAMVNGSQSLNNGYGVQPSARAYRHGVGADGEPRREKLGQ